MSSNVILPIIKAHKYNLKMNKKNEPKKNELHLVVTGYWYDKIESGVKKEEYRTFAEYWIKRLCVLKGDEIIDVKTFDSVKIHRGYTSKHMIFANPEIFIDTFENEIPEGVEKGSTVFTITLPKLIFKS